MSKPCSQFDPLKPRTTDLEKDVWIDSLWTKMMVESSCFGICEEECSVSQLGEVCRSCLQNNSDITNAGEPSNNLTNQSISEQCAPVLECLDCVLDVGDVSTFETMRDCVIGEDGLSVGAVIGIILGTLVGVLLISLAIYYGVKNKK